MMPFVFLKTSRKSKSTTNIIMPAKRKVVYPLSESLIRTNDRTNSTFIGREFSNNPDYGFLPHLEYFLENKGRWPGSENILNKLLKTVPGDSEEAWEEWRKFRSAEAEVTAIFLIENYLAGRATGLKVQRPSCKKDCDIAAYFNEEELFIEVKSQSGQQHGDKHPLSNDFIGFYPKDEDDLRSWLFEKKISSRDGKPMKPYCIQASEKKADILFVMTDIFNLKSNNMQELGRFLAPDADNFSSKNFYRKHQTSSKVQILLRRIVKLFSLKKDYMIAKIVSAGAQTSSRMHCLREIWFYDHHYFPEFLIVRRNIGKKQ